MKTETPKQQARRIVKETRENIRWVKKLRKLGSSDQSIAEALGITIEHPAFSHQG